MKKGFWKRCAALALSLAMAAGISAAPAAAKTAAGDQRVETAFFYVTNAAGQDILVSQLPVAAMEQDLENGMMDNTLHNYSLLDSYVTPVHQEAQGLTVAQFVEYAQSKSTADNVAEADLTFQGKDAVSFWEMDKTGYKDQDTYTYDQLYGTKRYNSPLIYQYWDFKTQDFYDPAGKLSRAQVLDKIFAAGEEETFLLGVRGYSQRYMVTQGKYGTGDYDMENYWQSQGLLDSARSLRVMVGMTKEDLYSSKATASNTRYWVQNVRLTMASRPQIAPTGAMQKTTDGSYLVKLACSTPGATIYYNGNPANAGYMPTARYDGAVTIPANLVKNDTLTLTVRAVKDGCTDAGITTLKLTASGDAVQTGFTDVKSGDWYYDAVHYVVDQGLFQGTGSGSTFSPEGKMSRAMFVTVMSRLEKAELTGDKTQVFSDVPADAWHFAYVNWGARTGLVNGTGNGRFSPDADISLESMLVVLYRAAGSPAGSSALPARLGTVDDWAKDAVAWAEAKGLFANVGGTLTAAGSATRAQVAAILKNYVAGQ